jgi:polyhydroxyalkanoate synthesis regulator protein
LSKAALATRTGSGHNRAMPEQREEAGQVLIKRYAGRRLYNTVTATYLSLDNVADMVLNGQRFIVRESETGRDITRNILDRLH